MTEADNATDGYASVLEAGLISRLDHAAYLGRELARAEPGTGKTPPPGGSRPSGRCRPEGRLSQPPTRLGSFPGARRPPADHVLPPAPGGWPAVA